MFINKCLKYIPNLTIQLKTAILRMYFDNKCENLNFIEISLINI